MCECWVLPIPLSLPARLPQAEFTPKGCEFVYFPLFKHANRKKQIIAEDFGAVHGVWGVCTALLRALPSVSPLLVKTPRLRRVVHLHQWCERHEQTGRENTAFRKKEVTALQAFQLLILPIPARQIK